MARMVESRDHGIFSHNGLLGRGDATLEDLSEPVYAHQYDVFLSGGVFQYYSLYKSASGGQAFFFSLLHGLSPLAAKSELGVFRALLALMMALTLALFIAWLAEEFDVVTAVFVGFLAALSPWLTLFAHNMFYFIWASFLPLGLMAWLLARQSRMDRPWVFGPAVLASAAILFKCVMNGYDFIIAALSMPVIPFFYYAIRDHWDGSRFVRQAGLLFAGIAAAVVLSILLLAWQLAASEGGFISALANILATLGRRTYFADPRLLPDYAAAVRATPWWDVLWTYAVQDSAVGWIRLSFLGLIGLFAAATIAYLPLRRTRPDLIANKDKSRALIAVTWLALLVPVSWFVLFKGQAVVHTHTNFLAWYMPFTLFGTAMMAWLVRNIAAAFARGTGKLPTPNDMVR